MVCAAEDDKAKFFVERPRSCIEREYRRFKHAMLLADVLDQGAAASLALVFGSDKQATDMGALMRDEAGHGVIMNPQPGGRAGQKLVTYPFSLGGKEARGEVRISRLCGGRPDRQDDLPVPGTCVPDHARAMGKLISKQHPCPSGPAFSSMVPCMDLTASATMDKPKPEPGWPCVLAR